MQVSRVYLSPSCVNQVKYQAVRSTKKERQRITLVSQSHTAYHAQHHHAHPRLPSLTQRPTTSPHTFHNTTHITPHTTPRTARRKTRKHERSYPDRTNDSSVVHMRKTYHHTRPPPHHLNSTIHSEVKGIEIPDRSTTASRRNHAPNNGRWLLDGRVRYRVGG